MAWRTAGLFGGSAGAGARGRRLILIGRPCDCLVARSLVGRGLGTKDGVRLRCRPAAVLVRATASELRPAPFGAVVLLHRVMVARTGWRRARARRRTALSIARKDASKPPMSALWQPAVGGHERREAHGSDDPEAIHFTTIARRRPARNRRSGARADARPPAGAADRG